MFNTREKRSVMYLMISLSFPIIVGKNAYCFVGYYIFIFYIHRFFLYNIQGILKNLLLLWPSWFAEGTELCFKCNRLVCSDYCKIVLYIIRRSISVCLPVCLPVAAITHQKIKIGGRNFGSIFRIMIYAVPNIIRIGTQEGVLPWVSILWNDGLKFQLGKIGHTQVCTLFSLHGCRF
jgi:hypothetical protein